MNSINKCNIKLSDCNISMARYNELKYFCKQYHEKKYELNNSYGIETIASGQMPKSNDISKPTEQRAIKNVMLRSDIEMIEETVKEAAKDHGEQIYSWLLKSVVDGIPYEWMQVPLSRTKFYDTRRYFFYLLSQKR